MIRMDTNVPTASARRNPNVYRYVAGRCVIQMAKMETPKEATSDNRWAASVIIASEPAKYPPINSHAANKRHKTRAPERRCTPELQQASDLVVVRLLDPWPCP